MKLVWPEDAGANCERKTQSIFGEDRGGEAGQSEVRVNDLQCGLPLTAGGEVFDGPRSSHHSLCSVAQKQEDRWMSGELSGNGF